MKSKEEGCEEGTQPTEDGDRLEILCRVEIVRGAAKETRKLDQSVGSTLKTTKVDSKGADMVEGSIASPESRGADILNRNFQGDKEEKL